MSSSSAAETVGNIEELLKQILIRVPALSLIRFKCVSKLWLSLISDPVFRRRHTLQNPHPKISAFFDASFNSIPLETPPGCNPFKTLINSVPDGTKLRILHSCNGLFLCHIPVSDDVSDDDKESKHHPIYVVNPTTNEFVPLSSPSVGPDTGFVRYALAFDPSRSPHYKVLCVTNISYSFFWNLHLHRHSYKGHHRVEVYASETAEWERLDVPFFVGDDGERLMHFDKRSREAAVYCNGAVHWNRGRMAVGLSCCRIRSGDDPCSNDEWQADKCDVVHYFDIGEGRLRLVPVAPPVALSLQNISLKDTLTFEGIGWPSLVQRYFGECGGRLYLIEVYKQCMTQFEVLEMERDYSGWVVKYHVDLKPLVAAFPGEDWNVFVLLGFSQEDETDNGVEDTSTDLLLHLPGKIISYNLREETFKTSVKLADEKLLLSFGDNHGIHEHVTFPYVETLACL